MTSWYFVMSDVSSWLVMCFICFEIGAHHKDRLLPWLGLADEPDDRPRWREPGEFVCPVCDHRPVEHYAKRHKKGCGVAVTGLASSKMCLCARSQEDLLEEAEEWSYLPPRTPVLMAYLIGEPEAREREPDSPEPDSAGRAAMPGVPYRVSEAERERFRRGDVKWRDEEQPPPPPPPPQRTGPTRPNPARSTRYDN